MNLHILIDEDYIPTGNSACSAEPFPKPDHKAKRHGRPHRGSHRQQTGMPVGTRYRRPQTADMGAAARMHIEGADYQIGDELQVLSLDDALNWVACNALVDEFGRRDDERVAA